MDRKVIRVLKKTISKLEMIDGFFYANTKDGVVSIEINHLVRDWNCFVELGEAKKSLKKLLKELDNKMLLKTTIVQPVYGYWRDDNENREYVLDREEMQRIFNDKLNQLEEEGLL